MNSTQKAKQANITLVDETHLVYRCNSCGRGWWKCPGGCNSDDIPEIGYVAARAR